MSRHITQTEREGFEPSNEVYPRYAISSRARSTAPAPLQRSSIVCGDRGPDRSGLTKATAPERLALLGSQPVLLATSAAVSKDIGLLATFLGIGVIVGVISVFIAVQVRGERRQNQEYLEHRRHGL